MKQVWVRGTSGLPFLRIPIFEQKSVGRKDSRITLLTKFFVTQKITNVCLNLIKLSVSQAKLTRFRKTQTFSKTLFILTNLSNSPKTPILSNSHFRTKKCGSTPLQKTPTIPFYRIPILSNTYCSSKFGF